MNKLLERPTYRGRRNIDVLTWAALLHAESLLGFVLNITQGSYNTSVEQSAGTHAGGGAVDISTADMSRRRKQKVLRALRRAGFAAWLRTTSQGPWPEHIHAILVDHPALSPAAARQVAAYRAGRNGLANNAPDDGPRVPITTWRHYMIIVTDDADYAKIAKAVRKELLGHEVNVGGKSVPFRRILKRLWRRK